MYGATASQPLTSIRPSKVRHSARNSLYLVLAGAIFSAPSAWNTTQIRERTVIKILISRSTGAASPKKVLLNANAYLSFGSLSFHSTVLPFRPTFVIACTVPRIACKCHCSNRCPPICEWFALHWWYRPTPSNIWLCDRSPFRISCQYRRHRGYLSAHLCSRPSSSGRPIDCRRMLHFRGTVWWPRRTDARRTGSFVPCTVHCRHSSSFRPIYKGASAKINRTK